MPPAPAAPLRRAWVRPAAAAVAVIGGLALVALAARSRPTDDVRPVSRPPVEPSVPVATTTAPQPTVTPGMRHAPTHVPDWMFAVLAVAVIALLIPVLLVVIGYLRRVVRQWPRHRPAVEPPLGAVDPDDPVVDRELADGIDEGLARLGRGPVREAIIGCWIELERAAERAEVALLPSETAAELAARLLGSRDVDAAALDRLADLYREARFSAHELSETQRGQARAALERIRAGLARPVGRRS